MSQKLSILHIVNWYPNSKNPFEALWIQRHIHALGDYCNNSVLHIQVIPSIRFSLQIESKTNFRQFILEIPTKNWRLAEWLTSFFLLVFLTRMKARKKFDLFDFHIAYPLLTHWHLLKRIFKVPVLINEHWSAYHFNFHVQEERKLYRIKRIFKHDLPVVGVSQSLIEDIIKFAGKENFQTYLLPNIVDKHFFRIQEISPSVPRAFLMVSQWKWPKDPFTVIKAFSAFVQDGNSDFQLRIAGYGELWDEMNELVGSLKLEKSVFFIGKLNSDQIAFEMNKSMAFLHCSDYETFSVVCAESLCCGTPVIASAVGGIKEFVNDSNGLLVSTNSVDSWYYALKNFVTTTAFDTSSVSINAQKLFFSESVGEHYFEVVKKIYERQSNRISSYT